MSKKSKRLILEGKRMVINLKHSFHNPQNQPYSLLRHHEYLGAGGYLRVRDETNRRSVPYIKKSEPIMCLMSLYPRKTVE